MNKRFLTSYFNRKLEERFGSIEYEGKKYILTDEAAPTNRLLPDYQRDYFEMFAPAIDETDNEYNIYWIFKADDRELDMYDYTDVNRIETI